MKLLVSILFFISLNGRAQIIDLNNPTTLSVPDLKQKAFEELLKEVNCLQARTLNISCLNLRNQDTFLLFYPYEAFYQDTYLFTYLKKSDSVYGAVYYDRGFTKPLESRALAAEWKPGFVLKYSMPIVDPINMKDLLIALEDTTLRTMDTTRIISHDPDLFFTFYFGERIIYRVAHRYRSLSSPLIRKLEHQLWLLEKKLSKNQ